MNVRAVVKFFNDARGFGFLTLEDGREIFVHYSEIKCDGFKTLKEGQVVTLELYESPKGLIAKNVTQLQ